MLYKDALGYIPVKSIYPLLTFLLCFKFHPVQYDLSGVLCNFVAAVGWIRSVTIAAIFMCKLGHEMLSPSLLSPTYRHSIHLRQTFPLCSSSTFLLIHLIHFFEKVTRSFRRKVPGLIPDFYKVAHPPEIQ